MEIKDIRELAKVLEESGLTSLEFDDGDSKIKLEKNPGAGTQTVFVNGAAGSAVSAAGAPGAAGAGAAAIAGGAGTAGDSPASAASAASQETASAADGEPVKSPMVGMFYASSSPEAGPYVSVGSRVKKGDVLCIIEAMKLMNEIVAERDGEITEICVPNGQLVEYGQTLFRMR